MRVQTAKMEPKCLIRSIGDFDMNRLQTTAGQCDTKQNFRFPGVRNGDGDLDAQNGLGLCPNLKPLLAGIRIVKHQKDSPNPIFCGHESEFP